VQIPHNSIAQKNYGKNRLYMEQTFQSISITFLYAHTRSIQRHAIFDASFFHTHRHKLLGGRDSLLATSTVTALGHNVQNHLACLLAPLLRADNLNRLVLGLVAWNLDFSTRLLAEIVDGATTRADNKPVKR
jgi:hypothetical protein